MRIGRPPGPSMTPLERFWSKVDKRPGADACWEWTGSTITKGYGSFFIAPGKHVRAHRHAWMLANGAVPGHLCVCHRCDNRKCVRLDHLFLATAAENSADMVAKGRGRNPAYQGEDHPRAKLNEATVREMRRRYQAGRIVSIAKEFGVPETLVGAVVHRRLGRHVIP